MFPRKGDYMSVWDDFYRLSVLEIKFEKNSAAKNATIYGNGNNQVAVAVRVTVIGKDNKPLNIPYDELEDKTHLINYQTGEKLNWRGTQPSYNPPWIYSAVDKGYSDPVNFGSALNDPQHDIKNNPQPPTKDNSFNVIFYISASKLSSGLDIGVGINIPGVGEFNTTEYGTSTHNSPGGNGGSVFKAPSFVHVRALESIDYSLSKNVRLDNNTTSFQSFHTVVGDMLVIHNNWAGITYNNYEGTSSKATAVISPAQENFKFIKMNVLSPTVGAGFNLAGGGCDTVWGVGGGNYDATFIFVNRKEYGLLGDNSIHTRCGGENYYYTIGKNDSRHYWKEDLPDGVITVRICNHRTPRNDAYQQNWSDSGKDIRVHVTDEYGNSGTVSITVDDSSWPSLHVNA
ncbi:hypothetical protein GCM10009414_31830 [Tatumella terrea]